MNRIELLNRRYESIVRLAQCKSGGVEINIVADPVGAHFDRCLRRLMSEAGDDGSFLEQRVGPARLLRWKRIINAQPVRYDSRAQDLAQEVSRQARLLRGALGDQSVLDGLVDAAEEIAENDSGIGSELETWIDEVGPEDCVVVVANTRAAADLKEWLKQDALQILTAREALRDESVRSQMYVIGPPVFFPAALATAPVADDVSFLVPSWFRSRRLQQSTFAEFSEGAIRVGARVHEVDDHQFVEATTLEKKNELQEYRPQPIWGYDSNNDREPKNDEVLARKLYLSGGYAMWLDDGNRIRALDPIQPKGERVTYADVPAVREGTYVLLREGTTERNALYQAALAGMSNKVAEIEATQKQWKALLAQRIQQRGHRSVERALRAVGIKAADQARAWVDPLLVRPRSDRDFELLLGWLDIPIRPTFAHATELRRKLVQKSAQFRHQLEEAISVANLTELETRGNLLLDGSSEGIRGMCATRVMAVSPFKQIVPRHKVRELMRDEGGQWLE